MEPMIDRYERREQRAHELELARTNYQPAWHESARDVLVAVIVAAAIVGGLFVLGHFGVIHP